MSTVKRIAGVVLALGMAALAGPAAAPAQEMHGFVETLSGVRTSQGDGFEQGSYTSRESRMQLKVSDYGDAGEYFLRLDVYLDPLASQDSDLELREAFFTWTGLRALDLKVGRQVTTWGTGDLLFINDVFPKDWQSFFIGREDQYLKAPSDALRLGLFSDAVNLNVVWLPRFEADRLPVAERLAFYDPFGFAAPPREPEGRFTDSEVAVRAYRNLGAVEAALYGYAGWYRQPLGMDASGTRFFYPRLRVWGGSLRRGLLGGVASVEAGYYDSADDPHGDDPRIENSSWRGMAGFDRQVWTDFQVGVQGYVEWMQDHDAYARGVPAGTFLRDEVRQLYTLRLTKMLKYQTVRLSAFGFVSPTDEDAYLRAHVSYKVSDPIELVLGANVFGGAHDETLFGQLDANDNVFFRGRYSF